MFASYLSQDVQFFDKHKTGLLIDRLTSDVQVIILVLIITKQYNNLTFTKSKISLSQNLCHFFLIVLKQINKKILSGL